MSCRFIGFITFLSLILSPYSFASAPQPCQSLLLTKDESARVFDREFQAALKNIPVLKKLYLKLKKGALKRRSFERCLAAPEGCTATNFGQAIAEMIESAQLPN